MKINLKKGFTLIELLVVVAIIGILASLVIASVNQARTRGVDAAIKATMSSMRAQAELFYDGSGGYDGLCQDAGFVRLRDDVDDKSGDETTCGDAQLAWAVSVNLVSPSEDPEDAEYQAFCVDSTGFAGEIQDALAGESTGPCL